MINSLPASTSNYSAYATAGRMNGGAASGGRNGIGGTAALSADEQKVVDKLKARDREVRQHEQAHLSAAGGLAVSAASFEFERGPDGKNYAVGGEVSIDTSPGRTPDETIAKAQRIRAAALAPAEPSGQDRAVAAEAAQMAQAAQAEKNNQNKAGSQGSGEESSFARRLSQIYNPDANSAGQIIQAYA